ncbi:MAG: hypothetical protein WBF81_06230, partial [Thermoplasmata archaeon]
MKGTGGTKRARLGLITAATTVFVALVLVLLAGAPPAGGSIGRSDSGLHADTSPATAGHWVNQSEEVGAQGSQVAPYHVEYIAINNSSTLHELPYAITGANGNIWITVLNVSIVLNTDPLEQLQYQNTSSANASGTIINGVGTYSFYLGAGKAAWINYAVWTYDRYTFSFAGANIPTTPTKATEITAVLVNYTFAGHTEKWVNESYVLEWGTGLALTASDNESFWVTFPTTVTGTNLTHSPSYGVTDTPVWTFDAGVEVTPSAATLTKTTVHVVALGTEAWSNYTLTYTETNSSATSGGGFFVADTLTVLGWFYAESWSGWLDLGLIVVVLVGVAYAASSR